jgi:tetratricopeptide (TPR) repeat protein
LRRKETIWFLLVLLLPVLTFSQEASEKSVHGSVRDPLGAPLSRVQILADELGIHQYTDAEGNFFINVSAEVLAKGSVRLTFQLQGYRSIDQVVKLPAREELAIELSPRLAGKPRLPQEWLVQLSSYRKNEVKAVQGFLASIGKRLLILEGAPGVGLSDLALASVEDQPVFWWECDSSNSLMVAAESWGLEYNDQNLVNLARQLQKESRNDNMARGALAFQFLASLKKTPTLVVFNHFERWLATEEHTVEDQYLVAFLTHLTQAQFGKLLVLSDEKPVLPANLQAAAVETLPVKGFLTGDAVDYLGTILHLDLPPELLQALAEHYAGHPLILRVLAGSLEQVDSVRREERVRRFLEAGESPLDRKSIQQVFHEARSRLSRQETWILDLLTTIRRPLSASEILGMASGQEWATTPEEIEVLLGSLTGHRYLLERSTDWSETEERYSPSTPVRGYIETLLSQDKVRDLDFHRRALAWYRKRLPVITKLDLSAPASRALEYSELVRHAVAVADLANNNQSEEKILLAGRTALSIDDWFVSRSANQLLFYQLKQVERLLSTLGSAEAARLRARCVLREGIVMIPTDRLREGERLINNALVMFQKLGDRGGEAVAYESLGDLKMREGAPPAEIERMYSAALSIVSELDDRQEAANIHHALGEMMRHSSRYDQAEKHLGIALELHSQLDEPLGEANVHFSNGEIRQALGRFTDARKSYDTALTLYRTVGSALGEAATLQGIGEILQIEGRLDEAERAYGQADELLEKIGNRLGQANIRLRRADLLQLRAEWKLSQDAYEKALTLYREIQEPTGEATALRSLGDLLLRTGRLTESEARLREALPLFRKLGNRQGEANTVLSLGAILGARANGSDLEKGEILCEEAVKLYQQIKDPLGEILALQYLGDLFFLPTGRPEEANEAYSRAISLARGLPNPLGEANALRGIADVLTARKKAGEAILTYEKAMDIFSRIGPEGERIGLITCALGSSKAYGILGKPAESVRQFLSAVWLAIQISLVDKRDFVKAADGMRDQLGPASFDALIESGVGEFSQRDREALRQHLSEFLSPAATPPG